MRWSAATVALLLAVGCGGGSSGPTGPSALQAPDSVSYAQIAGEWFGECIECKGSGREWWVSISLEEQAAVGENVGTIAYGWLDRALDDPLCSGDLRATAADPPVYLLKEFISYVDEIDSCTSGTIRLEYRPGADVVRFVWEHPFLPDASALLDRPAT